MRVLFVMRHPGYVRNFASLLDELAARGHDVHVAFDARVARWLHADPLEPLCERHETLTRGDAPVGKRTTRVLFARGLRISLDYLRYFEPAFRDAHRLRERAGRRVPGLIKRFPGLRFRPVRRTLAAVMRAVERRAPRNREVAPFLAEQRPDVVLVTPLLALGSPQVDYIRESARLGIPTALCVASWDNLTNKGVLHAMPDRVIVWNEAQRDEAIRLHGVPDANVVVTGAQCYDHWFEQLPSASRDEFCRKVGLDSEAPFVLYLCSSPFVAPDEVSFVRRWLAALRSADAPVSRAGVLVRPHPQNARQWLDIGLGAQAVVWPPAGMDPVDDAARADYFDSMYYASAVVGINTSGMIEAAIVGRTVLTILDDDFRGTQRDTLHFDHLAGERGLLRVAHDLDQHVAHLRDALSDDRADERTHAFVKHFVRPYGLETAATPLFADAVEGLARARPVRVVSSQREVVRA